MSDAFYLPQSSSSSESRCYSLALFRFTLLLYLAMSLCSSLPIGQKQPITSPYLAWGWASYDSQPMRTWALRLNHDICSPANCHKWVQQESILLSSVMFSFVLPCNMQWLHDHTCEGGTIEQLCGNVVILPRPCKMCQLVPKNPGWISFSCSLLHHTHTYT